MSGRSGRNGNPGRPVRDLGVWEPVASRPGPLTLRRQLERRSASSAARAASRHASRGLRSAGSSIAPSVPPGGVRRITGRGQPVAAALRALVTATAEGSWRRTWQLAALAPGSRKKGDGPEIERPSGSPGGPLSCSAEWSGRSDSNARPPEPHSGALPGCATPRGRRSVQPTSRSEPGRLASSRSRAPSYAGRSSSADDRQHARTRQWCRVGELTEGPRTYRLFVRRLRSRFSRTCSRKMSRIGVPSKP